jgi:oligopeptide/dipeptide ABC transporter ATP-binding protein
VTDLVLDGLRVSLPGPRGRLDVVDRVSVVARGGRVTALVGESGSGKSLTALAALRLLPAGATIDAGRVLLRRPSTLGGTVDTVDSVDLVALDDAGLRGVRGKRIAMVFQEPMTALNPLIRVVDQVGEALVIHERLSRRQARERATSWLLRLGIPAAKARAYPHELSGGQRQRVLVAAALAANPEVLVADEPTTALDVTVQAQLLAVLRSLVDERQLALLLITHDMRLVAEWCDDLAVMYTGRVVERGAVTDVCGDPRHPYTRGLFASMPPMPPVGSTTAKAPLPAIRGQVPPLERWTAGCRFQDRCDDAIDACSQEPPLVSIGASDHLVSCLRAQP